MDTPKEDGGAAFPHRVEKGHGFGTHITTHFGMSLRDYFAAAAATGYIMHLGAQGIHANRYDDEIAQEAYRIADAMLRARKDIPHG